MTSEASSASAVAEADSSSTDQGAGHAETRATIAEFRNVIGGEVRPAAAGGLLDQINPATGELWARIPASTAEDADADAAVAAAHAAFPAWSNMPLMARAHFLKLAAEVCKTNFPEFERLEKSGIGSIPRTAVHHVLAALPFLWERAANEALAGATGRSCPLGPNSFGFTRRSPYGVVLCIVPFNAPMPMAINKMAMALAAGNTVVVKPPEQCSGAILRMGELLAAIFPPGVVNFVSGRGADVGDALVGNPKVRKITMTGSSATARHIQRTAAENLTSCIFELGGKSPNIVFPDADLDAATDGVTTRAIFTNSAGQNCSGGSRILIHRSILPEMLERIKAKAKTLKVGHPDDPEVWMGPVISKAQYDKIVGYIEYGKQHAELVLGGRYDPELVPEHPNGFYIEPTLFLTEDNGLRICQEEIFGPVAVVIPFDTEEEAIRIANDSRYGLAAAIWTKDMGLTHRMIRDLETGNVWVNTFLETRAELPVSAVKDSGYGHDEILEFTYEKAAVVVS